MNLNSVLPINRAIKLYTSLKPYSVSLMRNKIPNFDESEKLILKGRSQESGKLILKGSSQDSEPNEEVNMFKQKDVEKKVEQPTSELEGRVARLEQSLIVEDKQEKGDNDAVRELSSKYVSLESSLTDLKQSFEKYNDAQHDRTEHEKYAEQLSEQYDKILQALEEQGLTAYIDGGKGKDAVQDRLEQALIKYVRTSDSHDLSRIQQQLSVGTDAEGGYTVPIKYSDFFVKKLEENSRIRVAGARVLPVNGYSTFNVQKVTKSTDAVAIVAEAGAATEIEPTFGEITFTPYKIKVVYKATEEMVADSRFNVFTDFVNPDAAQRMVDTENTFLTVGTGTAQPNGIVTAATDSTITAASNTVLDIKEVLQLVDKIDYMYWARPKFGIMMHQNYYVSMHQQMGASSDGFLWRPSLDPSRPDTLRGYPVYPNNSMSTSAGGRGAIAGDFNEYMIADYMGTKFQLLKELYSANGYLGFMYTKRYDGDLLDDNAVKYLTLAV